MSTSPKISSFTIIVTFLCVALTGLAFIPLLPIKLSPSRTLPRLTVSYNMPGNSARVIEMEVTSRLERDESQSCQRHTKEGDDDRKG